MPTIFRNGIEMYIPDDDDMTDMDTNEHPLDCACDVCLNAKESRLGCSHNGIEWIELV